MIPNAIDSQKSAPKSQCRDAPKDSPSLAPGGSVRAKPDESLNTLHLTSRRRGAGHALAEGAGRGLGGGEGRQATTAAATVAARQVVRLRKEIIESGGAPSL
jgi:hypothetical protein